MPLPSSSSLIDPSALLTRAGIRADMTVSDLGCGTIGHFVFAATKLVGPNGRVIAVDILKSVLAGVASRAKIDGVANIESVWGDCELPGGSRIPDNTCDLTLVINNLYQSKNRVAFLREAARVTKPGGKVVVVDWKTIATPLGPPPETRVASETARNEATSVGLKNPDPFEPGQYHWGIIFTK